MHIFEYEVNLLVPNEGFKQMTTIVTSSERKFEAAQKQAVRGARAWVRNLEKTLASNSALGSIHGVGGDYRCFVRYACVATLVDYGDACTVPVPDQRGGCLIETIWVKPTAKVTPFG